MQSDTEQHKIRSVTLTLTLKLTLPYHRTPFACEWWCLNFNTTPPQQYLYPVITSSQAKAQQLVKVCF